jgi:hypothetical protein
MKRASMRAIQADNDVLGGIGSVANALSDGTLVIQNNCTNLIREIEAYVWDERKAKLGQDAPLKKNDHACFVGGTSILTRNGYKSILYLENSDSCVSLINYNMKDESLESDDGLYTQMTREDAEIWELELEDGKKLEATGDHKILTSCGMKMLQDLTHSDIVLTCNTSTISGKSFI